MTARSNALAEDLRRRHALADPPIPDGLVYLEDTPIFVRLAVFPPTINGALVRLPEGAVIWLNRSDAPERRRFTLFHEFGHFHLHEGISYCHADSRWELALEREADAFAAEMLMPRTWVLRDLAQLGPNLPRLAARYRVSISAMRRRLEEVGL